MEHVLLKATTTVVNDLGEFESVISSEAVDREKDIVSADGMVAALHKWNHSVPLAWNHSLEAKNIIGAVDPQSTRNINGEVVVSGKVSLESEVGQEAWRSFKNRTVGFSFGYLPLSATKRKGGGRHITAIDVYEITATPAPMNNQTRVLATKGAVDPTEVDDRFTENFGAIQADERLATKTTQDLKKELQETQALLAKLGEQLENLQKTVDVTDKEPKARSVDPLRSKADATALDVMSGGESLRKPPRHKPKQPAEPRLSVAELRAQTHQVTLDVLTGGKP